MVSKLERTKMMVTHDKHYCSHRSKINMTHIITHSINSNTPLEEFHHVVG